ncbi:MAG: 16S rRNA (cytosine(967)-C(5))-methyltransferase RsmB [Ignavibacteria bacterium]|jgi:16S rRNA (cytosine967-C5)-methyltransferase|nr:16S rRNA (cytosine(967)-C(5))-methyltransferase RsmB [Ignavibacteria bacterium]
MNKNNSRAIALKILNKFYSHTMFVESILSNCITQSELSTQDKSLVTEIVYGTIRWQIYLDYIIAQYAKKPDALHPTISNILRIALYQILYLDKIPDYAAVNEAVALAKFNKLSSFASFVNAVLNSIIRDSSKEYIAYKQDVETFTLIYSHPKWLVQRLVSQYGIDEAEQIIIHNNKRSQTTIRVRSTNPIANVTEYLTSNGYVFSRNPHYPQCITLEKSPQPIVNTPLFIDGWLTIQDTSAMLCASLTSPKSSALVIDLCAAPGGKTCCIAEVADTIKVVANDISEKKIELIKQNATRLALHNIDYIISDALLFSYPEKADVVLLDAPCSGSGTISKNPDIKHLRKESDMHTLIELQRNLLTAASRLVKPNGVLVYSTCSIDKDENAGNIEWFLSNNSHYSLDDADKYIYKEYCHDGFLQFLPHKYEYRTDGAFAARLINNG